MNDPVWRRGMLIVSIAAVLRLIFAAIIPLLPDETYYWEWSRHLAPGYFDHPSGIALTIKLGALLGVSNVAVRLGAIMSGWVAAMATIAIARRIAGSDASLTAAIVVSVLPLAAAGLVLATPDAPLLAATAAGLYCVTRALESPARSRESLRWWTLSGVALGAAFTSKYTGIFLPVGVALAIVLRPSLRGRLREPGPYVACIIATIVFLPVLIWNSQHEWISFVFQIRHGLAKPEGSALRAAWRHQGDFWGGQIGLASPILFFLFAFVVLSAAKDPFARRRGPSAMPQDDIRFVLAIVALVSFGFFVYSALRQRVEPNWPAPAYIPAIVLLATADRRGAGKKWLNAGIIVAGVMSLVIYLQGVAPILPIPPAKDPIGRAFGWTDVADAAGIAARAVELETGKRAWLAGDRYQEASEIAFHHPEHPVTFATNLSGRTNQYDLWPRFADVAARGDNLVLVLDDSPADDPHAVIRALLYNFTTFRRGPLAELRRGDGLIGTRRVWTLVGWRGTWPRAR